ncbi:MAG: glycosyltransferase family 4 protein [Gammaproteobacteria bacterium]|nr:glycosyltransferase family 4 protein [Gammaproteobacteria bacterium]
MFTQTEANKTKTIWINARFLDRPVTGVERVAREMLTAMATRHLDSDGCWTDAGQRFQLKLLAPKSADAASPWPNIELCRAGLFSGHAWEQFDLPRLTRVDWLVSLCNTGPLLKRNHVLFIHDAQPFVIPKNFSLSFRLWYRVMFHVAGRMAKRIVVNSRFTARELAKHVGLSAEKMTLCYPGCEHAHGKRDELPDLSRFDLPSRPFVLAVASANPNKNFESVVQALDMLGDQAPPCVIVGKTEQRQFGGVIFDEERVTHLGYVSDEELLALYRRALCLVFPSFYEGFGLPPLEAMASSCPVISSYTSAMPEISGDAAIYCDPHDFGTLARAIRRINESPARRKVLVNRGRKQSEKFSWRTSGNELMQLLTEVNNYPAAACSPKMRRKATPVRSERSLNSSNC